MRVTYLTNKTMSKTKNDQQQPTKFDELLKNGKAVLTASTREELAEMLNEIPADCKYMVGAVGRSHDGSTYSIRIDLVKN